MRHEVLLAYETLCIAGTLLLWSQGRTLRGKQDKNAELATPFAAVKKAGARLVRHERVKHELGLAHNNPRRPSIRS